jgi:hypothetical protein
MLPHFWTAQVVLPSFASWFEMEEVHDIERQALADLTSSPDDSSKYLSLRNRIISLYRDIPGRPLAAMDCIRHFTGRNVLRNPRTAEEA